MGVHHFSLALAPRAYFGGQLPRELSTSDFERGEDADMGWWKVHPPSEDLLLAIRSLLPNDRAWSGGEVEEYTSGGEWESDVRIWKEEGRVDGITFRYSPIGSPWSDVQKFLTIARLHSCVLVEVQSRLVLEPEDDAIARSFQSSRSAKFVQNPAGTLKQAAAELRGELPNKSLERARRSAQPLGLAMSHSSAALDHKEVESLLADLCVDYGFCLPSEEHDKLVANPPQDVAAFVDAVFLAEGLNPTTANRTTYRAVRDRVAASFARSVEHAELHRAVYMQPSKGGSAPTVKASVTFLTREEGGRSTPAIGFEMYRPHVVVGDPNQRVAITATDGRTIVEEYLGVRFTGTDNDILIPGRAHDVSLELCYFPSVDYTALKIGAEFTIREGEKVVGYGRVIEATHLGAT